MPRKFDLKRLKQKAMEELNEARAIVAKVESNKSEYLFARWVCRMAAVDVHETWERYVEDRLAAALNHSPSNFLKTHDVKGVSNISAGFAYYIVRNGGRFFDFKGTSDLLAKGDDWLSKSENPFRKLTDSERRYIDALAAIRNFITHGSDAANKSYQRHLKEVYAIKYPPTPGEFLLAKANKAGNLERYKPRIYGLIKAIELAVHNT